MLNVFVCSNAAFTFVLASIAKKHQQQQQQQQKKRLQKGRGKECLTVFHFLIVLTFSCAKREFLDSKVQSTLFNILA